MYSLFIIFVSKTRTGKKKFVLNTGRIVIFILGVICVMPSQETRKYGSELPTSKSATGRFSHFETLTTRCFSFLLRWEVVVADFGCSGRSFTSVSSSFIPFEHSRLFTFPL